MVEEGVMMEDENARHWFFEQRCLGLARGLLLFLQVVLLALPNARFAR